MSLGRELTIEEVGGRMNEMFYSPLAGCAKVEAEGVVLKPELY